MESLFRAPTKVVVTDDLSITLPRLAQELDSRRIVLLIDQNVGSLTQVTSLVSSLEDARIDALMTRLLAAREPEVGMVDQTVDELRELKPDLVIGLGGGSVIDLGKAVAVMLYNDGPAASYQGRGLVRRPGARKIMIPTTAGTGAEVTPGAVVVNPETKRKGAISSEFVFPDYAVLEPSLTLRMPASVSLATGMDALAHSLESYAGRAQNPLAKACAREAYRMISGTLPFVLGSPNDITLRSTMLAASTLAGYAIYNLDTGAAHSMAYALGTYFGVPHAVAVATLLPHVVEHNVRGGAKAYLDLGSPDDIVGLLRSLASTGVLPRLADFGVTAADVPFLAEKGLALKTAVENNPVPFEMADAIRVLAASLDT